MARKVLITKTCTKSGRVYTGTFEELTESFYRDKSQKDNLSPWDKQSEREYNKAYRAGLKAADAPKKQVIEDDDAMAAFESAMAPERVVRTKGTKNKNEKATQRAASKTRTTQRKRAQASKKAAKKAPVKS